MKTEEIKLKWQKHNRDHGMSWNEVAELVNEVTQPTVSEENIYDAVISELEINTINWRGKSVIVSEHYERIAENVSESLNVHGDAQQRYEKALQYVERAVHIDGELDQDKALRIAAGLKDKP